MSNQVLFSSESMLGILKLIFAGAPLAEGADDRRSIG